MIKTSAVDDKWSIHDVNSATNQTFNVLHFVYDFWLKKRKKKYDLKSFQVCAKKSSDLICHASFNNKRQIMSNTVGLE